MTKLSTVTVSCNGQRKEFLVDVVQTEKVRNTIGCGDSFQAGYAAAYLQGRDISECVRLGMRVARQVV